MRKRIQNGFGAILLSTLATLVLVSLAGGDFSAERRLHAHPLLLDASIESYEDSIGVCGLTIPLHVEGHQYAVIIADIVDTRSVTDEDIEGDRKSDAWSVFRTIGTYLSIRIIEVVGGTLEITTFDEIEIGTIAPTYTNGAESFDQARQRIKKGDRIIALVDNSEGLCPGISLTRETYFNFGNPSNEENLLSVLAPVASLFQRWTEEPTREVDSVYR